jgi:hypothetical protein
MLSKSLVLILIVTSLLFGCAGNSAFIDGLIEINPPQSMKQRILENIETGKMLAKYDNAAWKASDLLNSEYPDRKQLGKFFYFNGKAYFGLEKEGVFLAYYTVDCTDKKVSNLQKHDNPISSEILTKFSKAVDESKMINEKFMISQDSKYNYYAVENFKTITVWWIPAMTNENDVLCGGIRSTFNKETMDRFENTKLHQTVVKVPHNVTDENFVMRNHHILSDIPNEVDFAHFFIKQNTYPEHMITNEDYAFYLNCKLDPVIRYYYNTLKLLKPKIFGAIFEIQTDNTGKTINVNLTEALSIDKSQLIQPSEQFKKNCNDMLLLKTWDKEAKTFYYNLYYDTTRPDIPMIYSEKEKKFIHLW